MRNSKNMKYLPYIKSLLCVFFVLTWLPAAHAETGDYNIHLETGPGFALSGWQAEELGVGVFGAARFEFALTGWFGIDIGGGYLQFFGGEHPAGYKQIDGAYWYNGCLGVRFRPLNDEQGYKWPWRETPDHAGNLWGNLWLDLHADYFSTGDLNRFGADAAIGAEFSLLNGLQVGPFARAVYVFQPNSTNDRDSADAWILLAGLSFSVAIPPGGKKMNDRDVDQLFDPVDKCPDDPEDHDGFEDEDGCPDLDNDGDGIPDKQDNCPLSVEDRDGVEDEDGCPDLDNDSDGIPDDKDQCRDEPEDTDGHEDEDGCPEFDNDGDGIADMEDHCPDEPELVNEIQDDDGCPEPDQDEDGFIDELDKCPTEPETVNGVEDDDGCPDEGLVEVKDDKILLGERVYFDFGMARIKTRSRLLLEHLANLIKTHPEYLVISIEGHADQKGKKKYNLKLSKRRAGRVRDYLIKLGVGPERLISKGYGESTPWIRKRTKHGRFKNRRVELVIVEMDESLATTPIARKTREAVQESKKQKEQEEAEKEQPAAEKPEEPKPTKPPEIANPAESKKPEKKDAEEIPVGDDKKSEPPKDNQEPPKDKADLEESPYE